MRLVKENRMTVGKVAGEKKSVLRIAFPFLAVIAAWQVVSFLKLFPDYLFPSPLAVAHDLVKKAIYSNTLLLHVSHSLCRLFLGYLLGITGGIIMGIGARWAGGCTSGHGISGTLQLAVSSWLATLSFLVGGIITAMILYRGL